MGAPPFDSITQVKSLDGGLISYFKPWRIPDDGFQVCEDALIYRGQLTKRQGYSLLGSLGPLVTAEALGIAGSTTYTFTTANSPLIPLSISVTDGTTTLNDNGNGQFWQPSFNVASITVANPGVVTTTAPHGYSNGDTVCFFSTQMSQVNNPSGAIGPTFKSFVIAGVTANTFTIGDTTGYTAAGAAGTVRKNVGSINYTTGACVAIFPAITVGAVTITYQYQAANPVMGLFPKENPASTSQDLIALDTTQAYKFNTLTNKFDDISGATSWTGDNKQFFWSLNYLGGLWVTNYNDPIRYYLSGTTWTNFAPTVTAGPINMTNAKILVAYKNRMLALSTLESGVEYRQRARWSQNGTPYVTAPVPAAGSFDANAWRDDIAGKGGYFDAPTEQAIVSCAFYKDTLIVFFERSTWELVYSGNELIPFYWRRVNSQFGSASQFSSVNFDEGILSINGYGVVSAESNNVKRIDQKIPDFIFNSNMTNPSQVHGIRDFQKQLVYWTVFSGDTENTSYPDNVLCYNYIEDTWAVFNMSFTCFGRFNLTRNQTWETSPLPWASYTAAWESFTSVSNAPLIVAGTSDGQIMVFDDSNQDAGDNFGIDVVTKAFNPFVEEGRKGNLCYLDIYFTATQGGAITLNIYRDNTDDVVAKTYEISTQSGNDFFWQRVYVNLSENFITLEFTLSDAQIADSIIGTSEIQLLGYNLYWKRGGRFNTPA